MTVMPGKQSLRFERAIGIALEGVDFFHLMRSRYGADEQADIWLYDWCDLPKKPADDQQTKTVLRRWLDAVKDQSGSKNFNLRLLGIVVDAEDDATLAFQSACTHLGNAGYGVPVEPGAIAKSASGLPDVAVFVIPAGGPGCLEHGLLDSLTNDRFNECVEHFAECIENKWGNDRPRAPESQSDEDIQKWQASMSRWRAKLKVHAQIAASARPESTLGESAKAKLWNFDGPGLAPLVAFVESLRSSANQAPLE